MASNEVFIGTDDCAKAISKIGYSQITRSTCARRNLYLKFYNSKFF